MDGLHTKFIYTRYLILLVYIFNPGPRKNMKLMICKEHFYNKGFKELGARMIKLNWTLGGAEYTVGGGVYSRKIN